MSPVALLVVLAYPGQSTHEDVYCDAIAVCAPAAATCTVIPVERCAGSYDPEEDALEGAWDLSQCREATVWTDDGQTMVVSSCNPNLSSLTVEVSK